MEFDVVLERRVRPLPVPGARIRALPPPIPRAVIEKIARAKEAPRPRAQPPPLPPGALERSRRAQSEKPATALALPAPRMRALPPPLLTRATAAVPPPIPWYARAAKNAGTAWQPGTILPRAPATISWALPPPPPERDLVHLERVQNRVEARAIKNGDAKSWYTTAAFEIRRAEISGDKRLFQSALLSLDFAERGANRLRSRLSGDRQHHLSQIRALRAIVYERLKPMPH